MSVTIADIRRQRERILQIAAQYRVRDVRVFGSVARGEASQWSDVDFLVEPLDGHTLFDRAGLVVALSELLGTRVDVAGEDELREAVRVQVLGEAVAL